jgi:fluoride exporter
VPDVNRDELAAVCLGGALGALLRVWLETSLPPVAGHWPWTTLAINLSGAFALACLATLLAERHPEPTYWRPLLGAGFCGTYTTFSTMQLELLRMIDHDRCGLAGGYALASVLGGYLAIRAGAALVRRTAVTG